MMRSVQRILAVLESFTSPDNCLSLHEIALRIDLPKSTAFRLLHALEQSGYLVRLEDQRYCLSFRITRLAGLVRSTLGIREIARPIMRGLAEHTAETVSLHAASGGMRVCIETIATAGMLRSVTQPGEQAPLTVGSSSKVLLAWSGDAQLVAHVVAQIARLAKRTPAQVEGELERIRAQGYAITHGERVMGVSAISAPIVGLANGGPYCLSVAGPMVRMQGKESDTVEQVLRAAAEISGLHGGCAPQGRTDPVHLPEPTRRQQT
jgi:DNA-binding IclR family transcriptional regulator